MEKRIVRFEIQDMLPIGLTLIVAGIGITYGMSVVSDLKSDMCDGSLEHPSQGTCYVCPNSTFNTFAASDGTCVNQTFVTGGVENVSAAAGGSDSVNASANALKGIAKIPEKMPLIATVIVAAIIIGILVRYLMVRFA